jgi:hypothetical protein
MFMKTYYLEFENSEIKDGKNKITGHSFRLIQIPFWERIVDNVKDTLKEVEKTNKCYAYLKRIERIK